MFIVLLCLVCHTGLSDLTLAWHDTSDWSLTFSWFTSTTPVPAEAHSKLIFLLSGNAASSTKCRLDFLLEGDFIYLYKSL